MDHTNVSVSYGDCPIPPQNINVLDYKINNLGDYLPPYIPGNERWMLELILSNRIGDIIGGGRFYAILRDDEKLFNSKMGRK